MSRLFVIAAATLFLASCRVHTPFTPADRLGQKRENLRALNDLLAHPASEQDRMDSLAHIHDLDQDLAAESAEGRAMPPWSGERPPIGAPSDQIASKTMAYCMKVERWYEEVWLQWARPEDRAWVEEEISRLRTDYLLVFGTMRDFSGAPYAYSSEHRSLIKAAMDDRTRALAAEKDPARRTFLEASLSWWKDRDSAAPK